MPTQLAVSLRGMRFHTLIGILPHERELPQPLELDLTAWVTGPAPLDYRALYDIAAAVAARGGGYLEEVADALASDVLAAGGVSRVEVAVRKPHVALPGPLAHAEVRLVRDRTVTGPTDDR
ncbi:MAG: dihydroneopterin aldolase [Gemmatimonadaceae bacterium]